MNEVLNSVTVRHRENIQPDCTLKDKIYISTCACVRARVNVFVCVCFESTVASVTRRSISSCQETEENTSRGVDYMCQAAEIGERAAMLYMAKAFETGEGLGTAR